VLTLIFGRQAWRLFATHRLMVLCACAKYQSIISNFPLFDLWPLVMTLMFGWQPWRCLRHIVSWYFILVQSINPLCQML